MLKTENLTYACEGTALIENISLEFRPGLLYGLLGPNGSGKSTLLKCLTGIWPPTKGSVFWQHEDLLSKSRTEISKTVALVPQNPSVQFDFTVAEMASMGRYARGGYGDVKSKDLVENALEIVDIQHLRNKRMTRLSSGERQRVYIARALVAESPVMLLDEPTSSLDIRHQLEIGHLLKKLQNAGKILVVAIHDLAFTERFCDRIAVLHEGKNLVQGSFSDIAGSPLFTEVFGVEECRTLNAKCFDLPIISEHFRKWY